MNTYTLILNTLHIWSRSGLRAATHKGAGLQRLARSGALALMLLLTLAANLPQPVAAAGLAGACPAGAIAYRLGLPASGLFASGVAIPPQQVANPFCGIYKLIKPWVGGLILLALLLAVFGFFGSNIFPDMSQQLTSGIRNVGIGLFMLGIVLTPGTLSGIATALGATGLTFDCP